MAPIRFTIINFGSGQLATPAEKEAYDNLKQVRPKKIKIVGPLDNTTIIDADLYRFKTDLNPKIGSLREISDVFCEFSQPVQLNRLACHVVDDGWDVKSFDEAKRYDNRVIKDSFVIQSIVELAYGDIDVDGDIDIAVKLMNQDTKEVGAMLVFHNNSFERLF